MTKYRVILLIGLTIATIGNIIWYNHTIENQPLADFEIAVTGYVLMVDRNELANLPYYDEGSGLWWQTDLPQSNIASQAVGSDLHGIGPDGIGHFIVIQIGADASMASWATSVKLLAEEGICNVGIYWSGDTRTMNGPVEIDIFEIVAIKDDLGNMASCRERHQPRSD